MFHIKKRIIIAGIMTAGLLVALNFLYLNKLQLEPFIIILVLGYLLSYKLVDYIADFKSVQNKSRIDIIFLVVFFILLFVPMLHLDKNDVSTQENRTLAVWKPLIKSKHKINFNFGHDFDDWYNDRFFLRNNIVSGYNILKYYIAINYFENSKGFINKNNHWMTSRKISGKSITEVKDKPLSKIIDNVSKLQDFCDKNGMKLYIIIAPQKEEICHGMLYPVLKNINKYVYTNKIVKAVKEKTGVKIVYPYDELAKMQENGMAYFKTDHHWTDSGAYLGYYRVMSKIKKDFPSLKILTADDFDYKYTNEIRVSPNQGFFEGITYKSLNLHDKSILDTQYKYFIPKNNDEILYNLEDNKKYWIYSYRNPQPAPQINQKNIAIYGDSFVYNMLPMLSASFRDTNYVYVPVIKGEDNLLIKKYAQNITENKPEILVICFWDINKLQMLF